MNVKRWMCGAIKGSSLLQAGLMRLCAPWKVRTWHAAVMLFSNLNTEQPQRSVQPWFFFLSSFSISRPSSNIGTIHAWSFSRQKTFSAGMCWLSPMAEAAVCESQALEVCVLSLWNGLTLVMNLYMWTAGCSTGVRYEVFEARLGETSNETRFKSTCDSLARFTEKFVTALHI